MCRRSDLLLERLALQVVSLHLSFGTRLEERESCQKRASLEISCGHTDRMRLPLIIVAGWMSSI
jgi:hypothetical protein